MFCVASVVHHTEASATIDPTDRSMPPPMITKVIPTLTTPMTADNRRMVNRLSVEANRSPAVPRPTAHSTSRASTSPRLRPALLASRPVIADGRPGAVSRARRRVVRR